MANAIQEAFVEAVLKQPQASVVRRILRVADRVRISYPKDRIKVSKRTAKRLRKSGVL